AAALAIDVADGAALAVEDADVAVVALADDAVADGERASGGIEVVAAQIAAVAEQLAGALVEIAHVVAPAGDHQPVAVGARPVVDQRRPRLDRGAGDGDAAALAVGARPPLDVTGAQAVEGIAVPRLTLAADLAQLAGTEPVGQGPEGAPGLDLGQLAIVANEHELAVDALDG